MKSKSKKNSSVNVYSPGDMLTVNYASEIRDNIIRLLAEEEALDLDLSDVRECDTSGIQILVSFKIFGARQGKTLSIINETEPVINEALALGFQPEDLFMQRG